MDNLTANQMALIGIAAGLMGGVLGWIGRGASFVLKRWFSGSKQQERAAYLNAVADLGAKMRSHGMTLDEVRRLESMMQAPSIAGSNAVTGVVEQLAADQDEPEAFQSNAAMKMRTGAAYEVAEARLYQALMDLQLLMDEREWECIEKAQKHWIAYRSALEDCALREYEGGTHATLALRLVGMAETERRADEIRAQVKNRAER